MKVTVHCAMDYTYDCEIDDDVSDVLIAADAADPICFPNSPLLTSRSIQAESRIVSIMDENGRYLYDNEFSIL